MKTLKPLLSIALILLLWWPGLSWAAMGIGISETCSHASFNACTTTGVTSTTGSTFIVCVAGNGTVDTPTDSKSNTYTAVAAQLNLTGNNSRCYQSIGATGGASHTFTGSVTGAGTVSVVVVEITTTGTIYAGPADRGSDAATAFVSPGITTTVANSMLVGFHTNEGNGATYTPTHGNSFTGLDAITDGNSYYPANSSYRSVSSTGTYNTSITLSATPDNTANWIMSYNEGGAAAAVPRMSLLGVGP